MLHSRLLLDKVAFSLIPAKLSSMLSRLSSGKGRMVQSE